MPPTILKTGYAIYPSVKLMNDKTNSTGKKSFGMVKELLFGDFLKPYLNSSGKYTSRTVNGKKYIKVRARGRDGYILPSQIQPSRILEVNFIDVGQGDGAHIVTPDDEHYIIDSGPADNMYRFLKWRFNLKKASTPPPPFNVVISHSDADHYEGFNNIFNPTEGSRNQFTIKSIYHNGMIEQSGTPVNTLGKIVKQGNTSYVSSICESPADAAKRIKSATKPGTYIKTLKKSSCKNINGLNRKDRDVPVYLHQSNNLEMEVMGPFAQMVKKNPALPVFSASKGKTKNGHSVMFILKIGKIRILLGGDLNSDSEDYLLTQYSDVDVVGLKKELSRKNITEAKRNKLLKELDDAVQQARKYLQCDIVKSCHHGSSDFTSEFLNTLNPLATIVSSGDDEPHCHPRPDTLGTIGKYSRGERSLIFSTELARSTLEFLDLTKIKDFRKKRERLVTVYGMINLRTDGKKLIIAQKLERRAPRGDWDLHQFEWDDKSDELKYIMD